MIINIKLPPVPKWKMLFQSLLSIYLFLSLNLMVKHLNLNKSKPDKWQHTLEHFFPLETLSCFSCEPAGTFNYEIKSHLIICHLLGNKNILTLPPTAKKDESFICFISRDEIHLCKQLLTFYRPMLYYSQKITFPGITLGIRQTLQYLRNCYCFSYHSYCGFSQHKS